MEHYHKKTSSRDIFSFPSTPSTQDQDSDFEFGCLTPDYSPYKNSPADHLFYNGRLLPHSFPLQQQQQQQRSSTVIPCAESTSISRATSRTSSISSKDSLMSSRSNSVNSSRSSVSCSSARTSSSDNSERRLLYHTRRVGSCRSSSSSSSSSTPVASKAVMAQLYGSSQRWQHITPAVPSVLKREDSRRKSRNNNNSSNNYNSGILVKQGFNGRKKEGNQEKKKSSGFCLRFFKSIFVACRECHSMEPSINDDILQDDIKI